MTLFDIILLMFGAFILYRAYRYISGLIKFKSLHDEYQRQFDQQTNNFEKKKFDAHEEFQKWLERNTKFLECTCKTATPDLDHCQRHILQHFMKKSYSIGVIAGMDTYEAMYDLDKIDGI